MGPVLLRISVVIKNKKRLSVKVSFTEKGETGSSNIKLPLSYFKDSFTDQETRVIGHLSKIDPSRPWGEIEMKVEVIEKDVQGIPQPPPLSMGTGGTASGFLVSCL